MLQRCGKCNTRASVAGRMWPCRTPSAASPILLLLVLLLLVSVAAAVAAVIGSMHRQEDYFISRKTRQQPAMLELILRDHVRRGRCLLAVSLVRACAPERCVSWSTA